MCCHKTIAQKTDFNQKKRKKIARQLFFDNDGISWTVGQFAAAKTVEL